MEIIMSLRSKFSSILNSVWPKFFIEHDGVTSTFNPADPTDQTVTIKGVYIFDPYSTTRAQILDAMSHDLVPIVCTTSGSRGITVTWYRFPVRIERVGDMKFASPMKDDGTFLVTTLSGVDDTWSNVLMEADVRESD